MEIACKTLLPLLCYRRLVEDGIVPDLGCRGRKARFPIVLSRFIPKVQRPAAFRWFYSNYLPLYQTTKKKISFYNSPLDEERKVWSIETLPSIWRDVVHRFSSTENDAMSLQMDALKDSDSVRKWHKSHESLFSSIRVGMFKPFQL